MESDFKGLSRAWVENDPRTAELIRQNPDRAEQLIAKMAEALDRRRRQEAANAARPTHEAALTAGLSESCWDGKSSLKSDALDQLEKLVTEQIVRQDSKE